MDINNHSINEHVFGQSVGPAINIDLLNNKDNTKSKHKPKSIQKTKIQSAKKNIFSISTFVEKHH
jgi:hypothetical protein